MIYGACFVPREVAKIQCPHRRNILKYVRIAVTQSPAQDGMVPAVVGGNRQAKVSVECLNQIGQIPRARAGVLHDGKRVLHPILPGGSGHHLHKSVRPFFRNRVRVPA